MKVLLIPDKFKGSLTAKEVVRYMEKGALAFDPTIELIKMAASDGGDGFLELLSETQSFNFIEIPSVDPLGRKILSQYGFNPKLKTAYIELANASGLNLLTDKDRNVLKTSTYGTGMQMKHAVNQGAITIYVGLGGSATNDGGMGIATALGYQFLDKDDQILQPIGKNLQNIVSIKRPNRLNKFKIIAINDVENPLYGDKGAAMTYAKQKGGNDEAINILDTGLRNLDSIVKKYLNIDVADLNGCGAAGGTAYGLKVFFDADFMRGTEFFLKKRGVYKVLKNNEVNLIITGEGTIDDQTQYGKLVKGVADMANQFNIPVIAICGQNKLKEIDKNDLGLNMILECKSPAKSMQYNLENAGLLLEQTTHKYFKYFL